MYDNIWRRFWSKVKMGLPNDCWEWTANISRGYRQFSIRSTNWAAHRVSWMMLRGPIPKDMLVLHKCDNRKCVNPNHLFIGTQSDNVCDMYDKDRQGYYGHDAKEFSPEDVNDIKSMLNKGKSLRYIAGIYNTTHPTIKRAMSDGRIE